MLIYLEHAAGRRHGEYEFDLVQAQVLGDAARHVGCRGLSEMCDEKLGTAESQVRPEGLTWEEVVSRNAGDEVRRVWCCIIVKHQASTRVHSFTRLGNIRFLGKF